MTSLEKQLKDRLSQFCDDVHRLEREIGRVLVGQQGVVRGTIISLLAGGHVLLEGVPGLGKTLLVRTLADAIDGTFSRIQFTPDLMPADLTGTNIMGESADGVIGLCENTGIGKETGLSQSPDFCGSANASLGKSKAKPHEKARKRFEFQPGPVFANIVLADEINRATPKTQAALLEAMQEHSVTIGGTTHRLEGLFFVFATQNPLEMEGTYPLPEAQLDRFFSKIQVPFPTEQEMLEIMERTTTTADPKVVSIFPSSRVLEMGALSREIPVAEDICKYAVELVFKTHPNTPKSAPFVRKYVRYGASPRGGQSLLLAAKINAILDGRFHVSREDLKEVAPMVLRHRILLNFEGQAENISTDQVIAGLF